MNIRQMILNLLNNIKLRFSQYAVNINLNHMKSILLSNTKLMITNLEIGVLSDSTSKWT